MSDAGRDDCHGENYSTQHKCEFESQLYISGGAYFQYLLLAAVAIAVKSVLNRIDQVLVPERLGQKLHRSSFHGSDRHRNVPMSGNKNDGNMNVGLEQFLLEIQAAHTRQSNVKHQTAGSIHPLAAQKLLRGTEQLHLQTHRCQQVLERFTNAGVVINNKHDWLNPGHASAVLSVGRVNSNVVPWGPGLARIRPP